MFTVEPRADLAEVRADVFAFALHAVAVDAECAACLPKQNAALDRAALERQQLGRVGSWAKCLGALAVREEWLEQFAHAKVFVLRRSGGNLEPVVFDRLAKRGVAEHRLLQHKSSARLVEQLGQRGGLILTLAQAKGVDEFALGLHLAKLRRGTAGFFERHGGDPVVHEFQAKRVELPRAEVRHTAVTLLGHAVQQHRAVRVARGYYARVV